MLELVVGRTVIPYEVRRSARARRRRIVVTPERVEVVAPEGQSDEEIAAYVESRRRWVYDALDELRDQLGTAARAGAVAPRTGEVGNIEAMQSARTPLVVLLLNPLIGAVGVLVGGRALHAARAAEAEAPVVAGG